METNKVPKGKKVYIKGKKFKSGDVLPLSNKVSEAKLENVKPLENKKSFEADKK